MRLFNMLASMMLPTDSNVNANRAKQIPIAVRDEETEVIIYADLPGVDRESIQINQNGNLLKITARRDSPFENNANVVENFLVFGELSETVQLPFMVTDRESVNVQYVNGVITIRIAKHNVTNFTLNLTDFSPAPETNPT